jgi:ABC-type Fe3+/spermidine/putrescine transport system ATPase subunit
MGELLRTTGLHRQFRTGDTVVRAVDGIDLSVGEGEFVSIMGPSGCGKSTLLYLLGGLDRPTGGEIRLDGRRVDSLSRTGWARLRRRQIGFVFQTFNLVENLTVLQNVQLQGMLGGRTGAGPPPGAGRSPCWRSWVWPTRPRPCHGALRRPTPARGDRPGADERAAAAAGRRAHRQPRHRHHHRRAGAAAALPRRRADGRGRHPRPRVATTAGQRLLAMRDGRVVDDVRLDGGTGATRALRDLIET